MFEVTQLKLTNSPSLLFGSVGERFCFPQSWLPRCDGTQNIWCHDLRFRRDFWLRFAASTTWAYSYCLFTRANIRIDALYNKLNLRIKAILDIFGISLLAYYISLLFTNSWGMFAENWEYDATAQTTLATPLWIPQIFWVSGLGFFLVCLLFILMRCLMALIKADWHTIHRIAGVKSVEEEISRKCTFNARNHFIDFVSFNCSCNTCRSSARNT